MSLAERMELGYPPFSKLIRLFFKSKNIKDLDKAINQIANKLRKNNFIALGPVAAPIEKINNFYRIHIIIKMNKPFLFQDYYSKNLNKIFSNLKGTKFRIDVDPLSLL